MTQTLPHVKTITDALAKELDERHPPIHPKDGMDQFIQQAQALGDEKPSQNVMIPLAMAAVILCALSGVAALLWDTPRDVAPPSVSHLAPVSGDRFSAQHLPPAPVVFDDGTTLALEPHAQASLRQAEGATTLLLHQGGATLSGHHEQVQRWSVRAGPYTVHVKGTTFSVHWAPQEEAFSVTLDEGEVWVEGPGFDEALVMKPGESVWRSSKPLAKDAEVLQEEPPVPLVKPVQDEIKPRPKPKLAPKPTQNSSPALDWRALADARRYKEALALATQSDLERFCKKGGVKDLLRLADVARFAAKVDISTRLLLCVRQRPTSKKQLATTSYLLGQLARRSRDKRGAIKWFSLYLRELPQGPLEREALGQLMDLQQGRAAALTAKRYLKRFPNGVHAPHARQILAGP